MSDLNEVLEEDSETAAAPDRAGTQQEGSGPSAATYAIAATGSLNTDAAG